MSHRLICLASAATAILGLVGFSSSAQAANLVGTGGIQFDRQTQVNFNFINSQGAYTSSLRLVEDLGSGLFREVKTLFTETRQSDNRGANDWLGTCGVGKTVANCTESFTFQGGTRYALLLDSGNNGRVFSTSAMNTRFSGSQQAKFFDNAANYPTQSAQFDMRSFLRTQPGGTNVNPFAAPVLIAFDDRGAGNDQDFNDFKFTMQVQADPEAVPEPATLAGLGLVAGALAVHRRRAVSKAS